MYIAIMGHGTVGSGVAEVISTNKSSIIKKNALNSFDIKYILDLREFPDSPYKDKFTKNFSDIVSDKEVSVVVETMGGLHPAYEFVRDCLCAGKNVVTSNKELVSEFGFDLLKIAKDHNVNFLFEASVGGGIPIIRPISKCLSSNDIEMVAGILNGTTNFILTKMIKDDMSLETALSMAQKNGYAEKDPTNDIEGHDACRKICILASLCFGHHIYPKDIETQGITKISLSDAEYASSFCKVIKLIGSAYKTEDNKVCAEVSPAMLDDSSPLASVDDVFNAIMVKGNAVDELVFYGRGAGKLPTASAVVADVIDCLTSCGTKVSYSWDDEVKDYLVNSSETQTQLYVRGFSSDIEKTIQDLGNVFEEVTILHKEFAPKDELAFITERALKSDLLNRINSINGFDVQSVIRLVDF